MILPHSPIRLREKPNRLTEALKQHEMEMIEAQQKHRAEMIEAQQKHKADWNEARLKHNAEMSKKGVIIVERFTEAPAPSILSSSNNVSAF